MIAIVTVVVTTQLSVTGVVLVVVTTQLSVIDVVPVLANCYSYVNSPRFSYTVRGILTV